MVGAADLETGAGKAWEDEWTDDEADVTTADKLSKNKSKEITPRPRPKADDEDLFGEMGKLLHVCLVFTIVNNRDLKLLFDLQKTGMQAKYTGVRTLNTSALEEQRRRNEEKAVTALRSLDNELEDNSAFGGDLEDLG